MKNVLLSNKRLSQWIFNTQFTFKITSYKLQVSSELQFTNNKLQITISSDLQVISYNYKLRHIYNYNSKNNNFTEKLFHVNFNLLLERGVNFVLLPRTEKKNIFDVSSFSSKRIIKIQKFST